MLNVWGKPLFQSHKMTVIQWWLAENIVLIRFAVCGMPGTSGRLLARRLEKVRICARTTGSPVFPPLSAVVGPTCFPIPSSSGWAHPFPTCFPTPFSSGWAHLFSHPFQQWLGPSVFPPLSHLFSQPFHTCFPTPFSSGWARLFSHPFPTCFPTPFSSGWAHLLHRS